MKETDQDNDRVIMTPLNGFLILLLVMVAVIGWIALGTFGLGITSFFASFLFLWYWASVEQADFKQWPQCIIGALVGLGLAWQLSVLPQIFGTAGTIGSLLIIIAVVYVQVMNWFPIAINRCAMLYLTVLAAPALLKNLDVLETAMAIGGSAVFFGGAVKLAMLWVGRKK